MDAYDPDTGKLIWRFWTTEPTTWAGDTYLHGGASVWGNPSYDPDLHLLYFTTGNAYPWPWASQRRTADDKIAGYTESQRFFLSFGQLWCENQTFFSARQSDPHLLGRARVNGTVKNFEEFGKVFRCAKGQPMYPEKSCRVW